MMDRKGIVILPSWSDAFRAFNKSRSTGDILSIINDYCTTGKEPVLPEKGEVTVAWILIKPLIDSHYKDVENGKKGGAPKGNHNARKTTPVNLDNNPNTTPVVSENNPPALEKTTKKEKEKDIYKPPIVPQGGVPVGFDEFWDIYPKKVAKQNAIKAFERAKKVWTKDGKNITDILNAVTRAINSESWQKDNGKFIPYPASWLNGGRWDDGSLNDSAPEIKKKPVPVVTQCPACGSYDLAHTLDRVMCRGCGAVYDYDHSKGKWVRS